MNLPEFESLSLAATSADNDDEEGGWETVPTKHKNKSKEADKEKKVQFTATASTTAPPFAILLVGLPGSGKSTFARALEKAAPHRYVRINQDTLGSRKKCESAMKRALDNKDGDTLCPVIDRCNFDLSQRKHFTDIVVDRYDRDDTTTKIPVDCIVFQCPKNECVDRCEGRGDTHKTIKPGMGRKVVNRMNSQLILPNNDEYEWRHLRSVQNTGDVAGRENLKRLLSEYIDL